MDYLQAQNYILSFTDYEKTPGIAYTSANYDLRRMERLLHPLGDPHLGTKTVHIAGTKGKGSTAAMIHQALVAAGYKAGLYTSPHLHTIRERIRINNTLISQAEFAALVTKLKPIAEALNREIAYGELTTFELLTAVAFAYFKKHQVDVQILEVGLGGRLDATNVAKADVCVITSISLDHTDILGDTVTKIATEKAGIIKPSCIVVSAPQIRDVAEVIEQFCHQQQAKLIQVGKDTTWHKIGGDLYHQTLRIQSEKAIYDLTIPLLGDYQLENAATAVTALEALASLGIRIPTKKIVQGLSQVTWPGRFQILHREPMVIVDGAHNAYSMGKLVESISKYLDYNRCFVIFGTSCDKDIAGMAQELKPLGSHIIITNSSHPRAAHTSTLAKEFTRLNIKFETATDIYNALAQALCRAEKTDLILVTGSLFVVAEALNYAQKLGLDTVTHGAQQQER